MGEGAKEKGLVTMASVMKEFEATSNLYGEAASGRYLRSAAGT